MEKITENLWSLLKSPDWTTVKLGIEIYKGNSELKNSEMDEFIEFFDEHFKSFKRWGIVDLNGRELNELPKTLKNIYLFSLRCDFNNLTFLPSYTNLTCLVCNENNLTTLPEYPNLEQLYCDYNPIKSLPEYPNLVSLSCSEKLKEWYNKKYKTDL